MAMAQGAQGAGSTGQKGSGGMDWKSLLSMLGGGMGMGMFSKGGRNFLLGEESSMNPYSQDSLQSLLGMLQGGGLEGNQTYQAGNTYLQDLLSGSPESMAKFEAPLMQNFEQNIVPSIANRFAGMGTGAGASSSSGLNQSLAQAGRGLQTDLGALRGGLQMQGLGQALNYANMPNQNKMQAAGMIPGQFWENPGQEGMLQSLLKALAGGAGKAMGGGF